MYRRQDSYYRRAKAAGYRSRAAYKLAELARRYGLLRRGQRVVDLGAWPGGWLQVAAERVGPGGRVVGVDLQPLEPLSADWVVCLEGDVGDPAVRAAVAEALGGPADVLLSDMAPKLTGVRSTDDARCGELVAVALEAATHLLRPGGAALLKVFPGADTDAALRQARAVFRTVKRTRPDATRKGSGELYAIALDHRSPAAG